MRPYLDDLNGLMLIVNSSLRRAVAPEALVSLIDHVSSEYCVDPEQIHAMGTGSTAPVAEAIACEASDRIASFLSAVGAGTSQDCTPSRPVPLLTYTGDSDRPTINALVARWVNINGCDQEPAVDDLGSGVLKKTFQNCDADVVFYDIQGMGHCFVTHEAKGPAAPLMCEYEQFDHLEDSYEFFAAHPLR
jgi:poly(3-hydroxybutyrate) depolymerase